MPGGSSLIAGEPRNAAAGLGRHWSHRYAERIVEDPDETRVWLVTRHATFREFTDLVGGVYETVSPSDEYRTLVYTGSGWELTDLDGTVTSFDAAGHWTETVDRFGNATTADYSAGPLTSVTMPDGRALAFTYDMAGFLETVTEVGVGVTDCLMTPDDCRTWTYTWSGPDLTRIDRPDGTAWGFSYGDTNWPGYMTQMTLEGSDGTSERIEAAWEYDDPMAGGMGNVVKLWRGAATPTDPDAVDRWEFAFDVPALPGETMVTDPLGNTATYSIDRDTVSIKPKVTAISGDCPACGLGPNSQLFYDDPAHPLEVTREVDGTGTETLMTYDANGQLTSRTEAAGTALVRTADYQYSTTYPALLTTVEMPSTNGPPDLRRTVQLYDATGFLEERRIEGVEEIDGVPSGFAYATIFTPNAAGQVATSDPPGYGTADGTSWSYDPARGDLIPTGRTDPLIGTTSFVHDAFNRRTGVTDVNGVLTETRYDPLDRVRFIIQRSDDLAAVGDPIVAADLATEHQYNVFGDLERTVLPEGNLIEYGYDPAGRLETIERKPDLATPGERIVYQLDDAGNRTREELQRWDSGIGDWVVESFTDYLYTTRCQLDQVQHSDGSVTEYAYDCDGKLERVWDAEHPSAGQMNPATTVYSYDELDRLESVTQPWAGAGGGAAETSYSYDVQDHLIGVTDAEGNLTSYVYSDRDLMTEELSPVSGMTRHDYNEHGELTETTDARGVVTARTIDELDRITAVTYPDSRLDVAYSYDAAPASCSAFPATYPVGRLAAISRGSSTVEYCHDRYGRMIQDGQLTYSYDENSNRSQIGYPAHMMNGEVDAVYSHDFADRPDTLTVERSGQPDQQVITAADYLPSGPLTALTFGNGASEQRLFTQRYFPDRISLFGVGTGTSPLLDWDYDTDSIGNSTAVTDLLDPGGNRTYGYQDVHYFLTQGDGPWGTRSWSYDQIGNRLTETADGGSPDLYTYLPNGASGNTPILDEVQLALFNSTGGGTREYTYGPAGHLEQIDAAGNLIAYTHDDEGRLAAIARPLADVEATLDYDGRSFLAEAAEAPVSQLFADSFESGDLACWQLAVGGTGAGTEQCLPGPTSAPVYSTAGLLHARTTRAGAGVPSGEDAVTDHIFYLAGRPVAQLTVDDTTATWSYLATDHLGTPIAATDDLGVLTWSGGFEPFGEDWNGAGAAGVFLRLPGQWADTAWEQAALGAAGYYNVFRWYEPLTGRYTRSDPLRHALRSADYLYTGQNPMLRIDPFGLIAVPPTGGPSIFDPAPESALECVQRIRAEVRSAAHSRFGTRYQHCIGNCLILSQCPGGRMTATAASLFKEVSDVFRCFGQGRAGNCSSALDPQDFEDNKRGRGPFLCRPPVPCEERCRSLRNTPEPIGGPFRGFADNAAGSDRNSP